MKQALSAIHIIVFVLIVSGCQKKDQTPPQPSKVSFNVISPKEGQVFKQGDTVAINIQVSYISQLHGYTLKITNAAQTQTYFEKENHVHGDHFEINEKWIDTLPGETRLSLELETVIDHEGNKSNKTLTLTSIP